MKQNINKIELQGCIGSVRTQSYNDKNVARISVATNYIYRDKEGTPVIETTWHNVSAWENGRGIKGLDTLRKGDNVHIKGRVHMVRYTDAEGQERTSYEVVATSVKLVKEKQTEEQPETELKEAANE